MRIAVLSDTHNFLPAMMPSLLQEADEIWHLGDVTDEACLAPLQALHKPLYVVRGNGDHNINWPWILNLEREGFMIRLIHIPPAEAPPGIDLVLHGHTHVPRNERVGSARFYNPGSVGKANRGAPASFAWLTLVQGEDARWEVVEL